MVVSDTLFRKTLLKLIEGKGAHADFDSVVKGIPEKHYGKEVKSLPYTLWELLEHIRLSQLDILEYIRNPDYSASDWPEEYWPKEKAPPSASAWKTSVKKFRQDSQDVKELIQNPKTDLLAQIPHGEKGHTIFREILMIADHTAYHLGEMVVVRRILGSW